MYGLRQFVEKATNQTVYVKVFGVFIRPVKKPDLGDNQTNGSNIPRIIKN